MKVRIDKLLVEKGCSASRERAQALVLGGRVMVGGQKIEKPGSQVDSDACIRILGEEEKYVSRGGQKLEAALEYWNIDLTGLCCMDVGASTGGFTDCMLQRGASSVIAVDTGHGQIDYKLRVDPRVFLLEKTNARYLKVEDIYKRSESYTVTFIAMDVSFISATLVLPAVIKAASRYETSPYLTTVILVKPQFEAGRGKVGKGGIVREPALHQSAVERVSRSVETEGGKVIGVIESPVLGAKGNKEFLLLSKFQGDFRESD